MAEIIKQIEDMLLHNGHDLYGGEAVTQTEHALQCAALSEKDGSTPQLITASLLHDIGHLLEPEFESSLTRGEDMLHEELGEAFLEKWFGPEVTQPVKLHVDAKRYLCATDAAYFSKLSPASVHSLNLQGGPMTQSEIEKFEANEFYTDALKVRIWDDLAKEPNCSTPEINHFMEYVETALKT